MVQFSILAEEGVLIWVIKELWHGTAEFELHSGGINMYEYLQYHTGSADGIDFNVIDTIINHQCLFAYGRVIPQVNLLHILWAYLHAFCKEAFPLFVKVDYWDPLLWACNIILLSVKQAINWVNPIQRICPSLSTKALESEVLFCYFARKIILIFQS